jgi:AcrR family transcriptional regulator
MRAGLMAAACKLFSEQGYEATTLQQIVKAAHTSIGNCYFYFPNKEAILLAIAEELRQEIARKIDCAIAPLLLGPGLLAVAVYVGALEVLERAEVARFALSDAAHPALRPLTMELFAARVERAFQAMPALFSDWGDATPQLAAVAWHGTTSHVLEGVITGRISEEPTRVARFLARWNLQALGLAAEAIAQGMETLQTYCATQTEV